MGRTDLDRQMPAKYHASSSTSFKHAQQDTTGVAVSAAVYPRKVALRFLRLKHTIPGSAVAQR